MNYGCFNGGMTKVTLDQSQPNSIIEFENNDQNESPQYTLYPNPTRGPITITNPQLKERRISIYTMSGALVSSNISADAVWSSSLEAGVYWVRLVEHSGKANPKVAIEKLVVLSSH